jgi:hypothetical protein|tara:strand:+ start:291 stop:521 length:231 start_codon:yes stop_codon:yes gene_type:complete
MNAANKTNQIKLNGTTYNVEEVVTTEQHRAEGRVNVANHRNQVGIVADLILRRPNGKKLHLAYTFANGQTQYVLSL